MVDLTISDAIDSFLDSILLARSGNTMRSYRKALRMFAGVLADSGIVPGETPVKDLSEEAIVWLVGALKDYAPASEQMYVIAVSRFYHFLVAEELADINLERLKLLIRTRSRRPGVRLPQFPRDEIEKVLEYAERLGSLAVENESQQLINMRDRALLLTLADTGLRVHEACQLRRGDLDWNEYRAVVVGKGDKQAVVRFSSRAVAALRQYINLRAALDAGSGRPLGALPLFARHDRGASNKVKPITTTTARKIVRQRVGEVLDSEEANQITPHAFRHYYVTAVLVGSGGNLKMAQELARHSNIATTQRYAHLSDDELDQGYYEIFEK